MGGIDGLVAGDRVGERYRIEGMIGGSVYRAHDERLRRAVAVKVGRAAAAAAVGLRHPNVVTVFECGTDAGLGLDFLVMELLHGEELAARIARLGPPPLELSLRILREAAEGLAAGHRAGLVHGDVRPERVFLEERSGTDVFRVCVLDFGVGRAGSPAADVYGLGAIGYELLTGERTFDRAAPSPRARNPEVSPEVSEVIEKALAHDPAQRYADAGELAKALALAQVEHEVPGPPPAPPMVAPDPPPPDEEPTGAPKYRARRHPRLPEERPVPVPSARRSSPPLLLLLGVGLLLLLALVLWAVSRGNR